MIPPPPRSTLFPYTTLFRSLGHSGRCPAEDGHLRIPAVQPADSSGRVETLRADRKSTRLNSSHRCISYAVFCLKKKTKPRLYRLTCDAIYTIPPDESYRRDY